MPSLRPPQSKNKHLYAKVMVGIAFFPPQTSSGGFLDVTPMWNAAREINKKWGHGIQGRTAVKCTQSYPIMDQFPTDGGNSFKGSSI